MKNLIKEVEDKTLIRINNLVEFYKTNDRFPEQNRIGEEDLSEIACHVRHCESSNFGYPSLMDRYPEQCKMILEKEKEIIIRKRVNELNDFFRDNLNQPPKMNKEEINTYAFWMWAKDNKSYLDEIKVSSKFTEIPEEMEISVEYLQLPSRKSIKEKLDKDKKLSADYTKIEELLTKVNSYYKVKESLLKRYSRFMNDMAEENYRKGLELESTLNEMVDVFNTLFGHLTKEVQVKDKDTDQTVTKTVLDLLVDNVYVKEIRDNEKTRKIEFIGTYVPEEDSEEKPKKKGGRKKKSVEE